MKCLALSLACLLLSGAAAVAQTEPEVYPRLFPPVGGMALSAGTLGMAVLGALLRL